VRRFLALILLSLFVCQAQPASACIVMAGLVLRDVELSKVVIVARVTDYKIIRAAKIGTLLNYAVFTVEVKDTLRGEAPKTLQFSWQNSTFGEPETWDMENDYVFALITVDSKLPPLSSGSGFIPPAPRDDMMTVLQAPCASAFIFKTESAAAKEVRRILLEETK
jgi:hypothetical protein